MPPTSRLKVIMMIPARRTPEITAMQVFFQSMSKRLAARVPVQAPVPGKGRPTNKKRAKYSPLPAFSCNLTPPRCPFSRQKVQIPLRIFLSCPHSKNFRANRKINGTGIMFPTMQVTKRMTSIAGDSSILWAKKSPTPKGIAPRSSISGTMETKNEIKSALVITRL